tara:strand:+ start:105 stop:635 length:531 start_codon:yes stop_codon:yes gene_type:complete
MIPGSLFTIPMWSLPTLNFPKKKKQLERLCKSFPETRSGIQTFATNRQIERIGFAKAFSEICNEELSMLSSKLKQNIQIDDIWSVSYKKGEYHTPHNHGAIGLTGILYLNMPKGGAVTQYIQPWNDWKSDRTIYYPLPVVEGSIVIVPKFVRHFTEPSKSTKIKRIISWDMSLSNA